MNVSLLTLVDFNVSLLNGRTKTLFVSSLYTKYILNITITIVKHKTLN